MSEIKKNILDIKSLYNIEGIFSFLNEKQKLNMIIYNKKLQEKFGVGIEDYKKISKRYKIGEKNGKGKEYSFDDKLIFEGEYLNGKRNGKGKEYRNGSLIFEGEYLNGKRNGEGKAYYDGVLIFQGEYINGERLSGTEYNFRGYFVFSGQYLNGKRWNGRGYYIAPHAEYKIKLEYIDGKVLELGYE